MFNAYLNRLLLIVLALFGLQFLVGCGPKSETVDEWERKVNTAAEVAERWQLDFDVHGTQGDGHFLGQSFNFLGTHVGFRLSGRPIRRVYPVLNEIEPLPVPTSGPVK